MQIFYAYIYANILQAFCSHNIAYKNMFNMYVTLYSSLFPPYALNNLLNWFLKTRNQTHWQIYTFFSKFAFGWSKIFTKFSLHAIHSFYYLRTKTKLDDFIISKRSSISSILSILVGIFPFLATGRPQRTKSNNDSVVCVHILITQAVNMERRDNLTYQTNIGERA